MPLNGCGKWAWIDLENRSTYGRFFCGRSTCFRAVCRKKFWRARIRLISDLVVKYDLKRFFTLTIDPRHLSVDQSAWLYIHKPWSKLRKRINRRFPGWKYIAVLEGHKSRDVPHIHGFTDVWMLQKEWSQMWSDCKGGKIVWVEKVKDEKLSNYVSKTLEVAKYVGKENLEKGYKENKGFRTLWRSKNTRADFELQKEKRYSILRMDVYNEDGTLTDFFAKKGVWSNGKKKRQRKDLERTRGPIFEKSTKDSFQHLEAKK